MKYVMIDPPRVFEIARGKEVQIKDCAHIELEPDEQVTFVTESGHEYDVTRKSWGFYATPSLNGRLQKFCLKAVLVKNPDAKYYILLVESSKEADFQRYLNDEGIIIVSWLDTDKELGYLEQKLKNPKQG